MEDVEISIVVPLYNEEESIDLLFTKVNDACLKTGRTYEILFVDDGSIDGTFQKSAEIAKQNSFLKVIQFRRNFGQTPAMAAGIDMAIGKILVTMDGDLQNDPADIPMMVNKLEEGYDLVVGWRHKRQDKLITRKIPSMIANRLIGYITGVPIKDNGCSLKVYRAEVVKHSPFYSEMHRFIPALLSLSGVKIAEVKVRHHARQFGVSKYGLTRIYKVLIDLLTIKTILSLGQHPIRWFTKLSLPPFLLAFGVFVVSLVDSAISGGVNAISTTIVVLFLSLGVFLVSLGVFCELVYFKGNFRLKDANLLALNRKIR